MTAQVNAEWNEEIWQRVTVQNGAGTALARACEVGDGVTAVLHVLIEANGNDRVGAVAVLTILLGALSEGTVLLVPPDLTGVVSVAEGDRREMGHGVRPVRVTHHSGTEKRLEPINEVGVADTGLAVGVVLRSELEGDLDGLCAEQTELSGGDGGIVVGVTGVDELGVGEGGKGEDAALEVGEGMQSKSTTEAGERNKCIV